MSGRSAQVLSRFPVHMDTGRPGKQLQIVATGVSDILDELSARMAAVRRSHRLAHADLITDLYRIGALHAIGDVEYAPVRRRIAGLEEHLEALLEAIDAADDAARDTAANALLDLFGVVGASPRLALFAPSDGDPPDLAEAAIRLTDQARLLAVSTARRERVRARIRSLSLVHSRGNATVRTLIEATASALGLDLDLARNAEVKESFRPVAAVVGDGTAGTATWEYVVVARSLSKNVDARSAVATLRTGAATLSDTDANVISWTIPPDALDFLVFRVTSGGTPAEIGLITPVALPATETSLRDTGLPASGALEAALDDDIFHSRDRFWHSSFVHDGQQLVRQVDPPADSPDGTPPADEPVPSGDDLIGIEENPLHLEQMPDEGAPDKDVVHGELFPIYRRGFGRSLLRFQVRGIEGRTIGPMLVNRDEGHGIGFVGPVTPEQTLVFDEEGQVMLDETDVTSNAFAWRGACFAGNDDDPALPRDFVFDGPGAPESRRATFVVAEPFDALDGSFVFPHDGDPISVPGIGIGRTRFAFFVQQAHFSPMNDATPPAFVTLSPRTTAGFADGSVFAAPPLPNAPAAKIRLSWFEHEAYAVRVLLPRRFSLLDTGSEPPVTALVQAALERHRAAGVALTVDYIEDRWILGESDITASETADPILSLRGGSVLWTSPP